jgi:hypothetical protein
LRGAEKFGRSIIKMPIDDVATPAQCVIRSLRGAEATKQSIAGWYNSVWTLPVGDNDFLSPTPTDQLSCVRREAGKRGIWQRRF